MNRVAGIGTSLVLIAAGAIMAFAVSVQTDGFNVNTIGWILMAVGAVGLIVSIIVGTASASTGGVTYVDRTVVEREPVRERIVRTRSALSWSHSPPTAYSCLSGAGHAFLSTTKGGGHVHRRRTVMLILIIIVVVLLLR